MKNRYLIFMGIGFELVGIILACLFIGNLIDNQFGTKGLGIALMPMLGLIGWLVHVVTLSRAIEKKEEAEKDQ